MKTAKAFLAIAVGLLAFSLAAAPALAWWPGMGFGLGGPGFGGLGFPGFGGWGFPGYGQGFGYPGAFGYGFPGLGGCGYPGAGYGYPGFGFPGYGGAGWGLGKGLGYGSPMSVPSQMGY
jgi:hypothetical protein